MGGRMRAVGTVIWEGRRRPPKDIFMATPESTAKILRPSPNASLTVAVHVAAFHFEWTIDVEGSSAPP